MKNRIISTAILISFIVISNCLSQGIWISQNPKPFAGNYKYLKFLNEKTGFSCSDNRTLLKTTDGGLNWSSQSLGSGIYYFKGIEIASNDVIYMYGRNNNSFFKTTNSGVNWNILPSGILSGQFSSMSFVNKDSGYGAIGESANNFVYKTTNGGINFIVTNSNVGLSAVQFLNYNTGFACNRSGIVIKTTNAGTSWFNLLNKSGNSFDGFGFLNESTGFASGSFYVQPPGGYGYYSAILFRTFDGGVNWDSIVYSGANGSKYLDVINIISPELIYSYSNSYSIHIVSTDGGHTWNNTPYFPIQQGGFSLGGKNSTLYAGAEGVLYKSLNKGNSWDKISRSITDINILAVHFFNQNTGVAGGGKSDYYFSYYQMLRTTNGGNNWYITQRDSFNTFTRGIINKIKFLDNNKGFASGGRILLYTVNAGVSWTSCQFPGAFDDYGIDDFYFLNENYGFVSTYITNPSRTGLSKVQKTGYTYNWTKVLDMSSSARITGIHFINQNTGIFVTSDNQIYSTNNAGLNFTQFTPSINVSFQNMQFINDTTGFACSAYGVFKTTNGGFNWIRIGTFGANQIKCSNEDTLFALERELAVLYKSTNGGYNWNAEQIPAGSMSDISFPDVNLGYAVGQNSKIVKYFNIVTNVRNTSSEIPFLFRLLQNYPNPFNPVTRIRYELPRAGDVKLTVYDVMGREVEMLVNERQAAGSYEAIFDGSRFASGVYFYRLTTDGFSETKRMILLK